MFAIFLTLLIVSLSVDLSVAVDNHCIKKFNYNNWRGLQFSNCSTAAEVAFKWKKEHILWTEIGVHSNERIKFELTFNERCTLTFEGKLGINQYGKWETPEGKVIICADVSDDCRLKINERGELATYNFQDISCGNSTILHDIDEQWAWTKIRVVNLPPEDTFRVVVYVLMNPTFFSGVSAKISFALFSAVFIGIFPL
ncbi:hypothetical protein M3Y96_00523500 [Aphelenchoides besseyi]|nr:hypothetical protein M3Y96_00523500 [Aphelenchoides besseyi]